MTTVENLSTSRFFFDNKTYNICITTLQEIFQI